MILELSISDSSIFNTIQNMLIDCELKKVNCKNKFLLDKLKLFA